MGKMVGMTLLAMLVILFFCGGGFLLYKKIVELREKHAERTRADFNAAQEAFEKAFSSRDKQAK